MTSNLNKCDITLPARARALLENSARTYLFFCERVNDPGIKSFTRGLRDDFHFIFEDIIRCRDKEPITDAEEMNLTMYHFAASHLNM